jgi:hypothetical protein
MSELQSVPQHFLDNLQNLQLVATVALEHFQDNRDESVKCASGSQVRQAEKSICKIRMLSVQIEKEFAILEYLLTDDGLLFPQRLKIKRD